MKTKGLTGTVIFESSAVNRDDKLGGNITSIKKLSRYDGTYSFMSRAFIRHHLFQTLYYLNGWEEAPLTMDNQVIQFKFPEANIIDYPEMDLFGFMTTSAAASKVTITRKAPFGLTKAISLEPWQTDMAFYANHDLVRRAIATGIEGDPNPNPFQKEEHHAYYRLSFTFDLCRLGLQDIHLKSIPDKLKASIEEYPASTDEELGVIKNIFKAHENEDITWRTVMHRSGERIGFIGSEEARNSSRLIYLISPEEKMRRIKEVITVLKNGISIHSSTENYGLVPVFFILGALKVPVPIFNSYVEFENGAIKTETLNKALNNDYLLHAWYDTALPLMGDISKEDGIEEKIRPWRNVDTVLSVIK